MMKMRTLAAVALLSLAACQAMDRNTTTRFEPLKVESGFAYYRYSAVGDVAYPEGEASAEARRMSMLEQWLTDNGHAGARYEIVERKAVLRSKALLGDVHDIYYTVRVPR